MELSEAVLTAGLSRTNKKQRIGTTTDKALYNQYNLSKKALIFHNPDVLYLETDFNWLQYI